MTTLNGMPGIETTEFLLSKIDDFGTPDAYNHYAVGWAHALCAPYQWTKQVASHWGGTRNGTIVHWPNGIDGQGRGPQPVPPRHRRRADHPRGGRPARARPWSTASRRRRWRASACCRRFDDAKAPETPRRPVLRDVRQPRHLPPGLDGGHQAPHARGRPTTPPPFDDDVWELYGPDDWTQAHDLAAENPEKLAELQRLWLIEAVKYNVVPLDDRGFERINPDIAGPAAADPRQHASCCSTACGSARTAC